MIGLATAPAEGLEPRQGGTFKLDDWTASIRYAVDGIFCRVVATIAPDPRAEGGAGGGGGGPIRFAVTLAPGQRHTVALARPGRRSLAPSVLEIAHTDDALSIEVVTPEDAQAAASGVTRRRAV